MATNPDIEERRAAVEAVIRAGKWSLRSQQQLAERFKCTTRTIRADKARIIGTWREGITTEHFDSIEFTERLRAIQRAALDKGDLAKALRAMQMEAEVCGHRDGIDRVRGVGVSGVGSGSPTRGEAAAKRLRRALGADSGG